MQLWLGNQELFVRLEHYRPYCYINYLIEPCAIRCDSFRQLLISLRQLLIYVLNVSAGIVLFGATGVFCGPTAAQNAPLGPATAPSSQAVTLQAIEAYKAKDYARAANLFMQAASQGDARAQFEIGRMYYEGLGVQKDCTATTTWISKAANQGLAVAQGFLATMYLAPLCVAQDKAAAASWFDKAANQNDAMAQIMLGLMLVDRKDYGKAMSWLRRGEANQVEPLLDPNGDVASLRKSDSVKATAEYNIGLMYEGGAGVPKDTAQAIAWYQKAAELGNANAKSKLAQLQTSSSASSETINLTCHNVKGNTSIIVDTVAKSVRVESGTLIEYQDGKEQYVTITDDSIDFGCRQQKDDSDLFGERAANLFDSNDDPKKNAEISKGYICLIRNRIDRKTGVWTAVYTGATFKGHSDSAICSLAPARRQF
jgi:TPR repeat protein